MTVHSQYNTQTLCTAILFPRAIEAEPWALAGHVFSSDNYAVCALTLLAVAT